MSWAGKPDFLPLDIPTAAQFRAIVDRIDAIARPVWKTSNQALATSNTTLQDVSGISWTLDANQTWFVDLVVSYVGTSGVADIKFGWTAPAGAALTWSAIYVNTAGAFTVIAGLTVGSVQAAGADTPNWPIHIRGVLTTGSASGTLQLQAAQNTSDAGVVTILAGTHGKLTQVT